jgi:hypothetical protein
MLNVLESSVAIMLKKKIWFTKDLYRIKKDMLSIRFNSIISIEDLI